MTPRFCEVAVPVPLEATFTYRLNGVTPVVGGRVLVPFREQKLPGIVTELHDREPSSTVTTRNILQVLDTEPVLDCGLLELSRWIAHYYVAPIGEVFRTMLPLGAEVRRAKNYRITEVGYTALHESATRGSSLRSRKTPEEQAIEYAVLDYLADGETAREQTLRSATGACRRLLDGLVAKKWVARQDITTSRDARRTVSIVVLNEAEAGPESFEPQCTPDRRATRALRKLNPSQLAVIDALRNAGGRLPVTHLRDMGVSRSSTASLKKRGLITVVEEAAGFEISGLQHRPRAVDFAFNSAQNDALQQILAATRDRTFSVSLLHGVTGSGKTAVYLAAMRSVLESGRSAIMLVPEIGLTPAAAAQLHETFGDDVAILHSALSADERAEQWHRIRRGEAKVVVGTRSAVFAPVADLALIVVDEEHDLSYKQEETPRYHARDVAVMRAKMAGAAVVLGSATPSLESYFNAGRKYKLISMPDRVEQRPLPEVELVDMKEEFHATGQEPLISRRLAEAIKERLERQEQVMVLLNRRGYSPTVLCRACGDTIQCQNCAISMTHHKGARRLLCHYCGYVQRVPDKCPKCGSEYVYFLGWGSEKLEEHLHGLFPQARIARLDRDTVRGRRDFERVLNALHAGEIDLLVGTQMIAKGHDIHGVTLVGVVGADLALRFPDFRAAERTFQLLTQVAGRSGRGNTPGQVILQTFFPEHYAIQCASRHDYAGFYEKEIRFRNWMKYPPHSALANVVVRSDKLDEALRVAGILGKWFERESPREIKVLGPAAAPIVRLKRDYRYHFLLKSASREALNTTIRAMLQEAAQRKLPRTNIVVDVDAQNLM